MASFSASDNGDGSIQCVSSGTAGGATWLDIHNNTSGFPVWSAAYSGSTVSVADRTAHTGTNSYTATYRVGSGGSVVGTLNATASPSWPTPSVSALVSGPYTGCSWAVSDDQNDLTGFAGVDLYYSINGGAFTYYTTVGALSGSTGYAVFAGYSVPVTWKAVASWTGAGTVAQSTGEGSSGTGPPPPTPPNDPSNLLPTDHTTSVDLTWTGSVGGASGYEISRGGTVLANQSGTTYTDSSPGSARPLTYQVRAYNSNASGTAYSAAISATVGGVDSCGVLLC